MRSSDGAPSSDNASTIEAFEMTTLEGEQEVPSEAKSCLSCPSDLCSEGALLLGIMTPSGRLAYLQPPTRIDAHFVAQARAMGRPEARFRFSGPCREAQCPQWTGEGCGVVDMAIETVAYDESASVPLPACSIRRTCRWYTQRGASACAVCPSIVADVGGTGTFRSTQLASTAEDS